MLKYCAFLGCILLCTASARAQDEGPTWLTDLKKARATANASGQAILANFIPAQTNATVEKLKTEVLAKPEFGTWAAGKVVLLTVELDAADEDQKAANTKLAKDLGVRNFPQILFLDAEGKKFGQLAAWIQAGRN